MNYGEYKAKKASLQYLVIVDFCLTLERFKILNYVQSIAISENAYNVLWIVRTIKFAKIYCSERCCYMDGRKDDKQIEQILLLRTFRRFGISNE